MITIETHCVPRKPRYVAVPVRAKSSRKRAPPYHVAVNMMSQPSGRRLRASSITTENKMITLMKS